MTPNNNLSILPFYEDVSEQDFKKFYAYGDLYALISPDAKILPFQIVREKTGNPITECKLIDLDGNETDILSEINSAGLEVKGFADYDIIINPGAMIFPTLQITAGKYFLKISDVDSTWFSDVFTVVSNLDDYLRILYWDRDNLYYTGGHIDYSAPFKNYCYVQTEIGKPEYPFEEEAQQRDGFIFIEKQISEKKYKFEFLAPEYLCDALRVVRMHDYIRIYFKGKEYKVENIIFEPKWKDQGNLAVMEVEFECDTIVKKIGKAIVDNLGDYNDDFNNDYNNQ